MLISQCSPVKPESHAHSYAWIKSMHLPWAPQALLGQSKGDTRSVSMQASKTTKLALTVHVAALHVVGLEDKASITGAPVGALSVLSHASSECWEKARYGVSYSAFMLTTSVVDKTLVHVLVAVDSSPTLCYNIMSSLVCNSCCHSRTTHRSTSALVADVGSTIHSA
jgi:hypothetical protein